MEMCLLTIIEDWCSEIFTSVMWASMMKLKEVVGEVVEIKWLQKEAC